MRSAGLELDETRRRGYDDSCGLGEVLGGELWIRSRRFGRCSTRGCRGRWRGHKRQRRPK